MLLSNSRLCYYPIRFHVYPLDLGLANNYFSTHPHAQSNKGVALGAREGIQDLGRVYKGYTRGIKDPGMPVCTDCRGVVL